MEQVEFIQITGEWTDIDDILTTSLTSSNSYQIECRGNSNALIQEASSKPGDDDFGGIMLDNGGQKTITYTVGSNTLYVKACGEYTSLNIVDVTPAS